MTMTTPELHTLLVLSSTHLSPAAHMALQELTADDSRDAGPGVYSDEYPYGYHLALTDPEDNEDSEWAHTDLIPVVEYARSLGATHVRIDVDGRVMANLPIF